jgi:hypothetical protein
MNIQDEVQKIHAKYGTTEKANYEIQRLCERYAEYRIEQELDKIAALAAGDDEYFDNFPIIE